MKKLISLAFVVAMVLSISLSVFAETPRVVDGADLISDSTAAELETKIAEIATTYNFDVVIVTENSIGDKTPTAYADDYFDYNGYGYGENRDGMLLLVAMDQRGWAISTRGYGLTAFTDYGTDYIGEEVKASLTNEDYDTAFTDYVNLSEEFLAQAAAGEPFDVDNTKTSSGDILFTILIIALFSALLATIVTMILKSQLKTANKQGLANQYVRNDSFKLTNQRDIFLFSNVVKSPKAQNNNGTGGTTSHTSSSGASHGGSSGSF